MKSKKRQATKQSKKNAKASASERTAKASARQPKPERKRTIKQLVIEAITKNPTVTNAEMIAAVKAEFPKSAFKDTHAAWYRTQARKGLLTGAPIEIPPMSRRQAA